MPRGQTAGHAPCAWQERTLRLPQAQLNGLIVGAASSSAAGSISITDCMCDKGYTYPIDYTYHRDRGACTACPFAKYKDIAGSSSCTACPLSALTSGMGRVSFDACFCHSGTIMSNRTCVKCPNNTCSVGGECRDCPDHSTSPEASQGIWYCYLCPSPFLCLYD